MRRFFQYFKLTLAGPKTAPHTKPFIFTQTWMRLYRFQDFYVDLSYSGNRFGAVLQGELKPTKPTALGVSLILLHDTNETILEERFLVRPGPFRFVIEEAGEYQFIAQIGDWVKEITRINVA